MIAQHGTLYSTVTTPPTDKNRIVVMCAGLIRKHVSLPPEFKLRVEGVGIVNENNIAKSIKNKSVDYVVVISRDISLAMPRDIVPIYIWRGNANSLRDNIYNLLGLPRPNRVETSAPAKTAKCEKDSAAWSEDEKAAIQIAREKIGAVIVSEMFPVFREALPEGPPRTLGAFFEQCQRQFAAETVAMARVVSSSANGAFDDDPEVLGMLAAAEALRATKQAAKLEAERLAKERAEAAARVEAARVEAARIEAKRLAEEREAHNAAEGKRRAVAVCAEAQEAEDEAQLKGKQKKQSEQQFRKQLTKPPISVDQNEITIPLESLAGLLSNMNSLLLKVSSIEHEIATVCERIQGYPTKTEFSQLAELVIAAQRAPTEGRRGALQQNDLIGQLLRGVEGIAQAEAVAFSALRDETASIRSEVAGLKHEIAEQTAATTDTLDTVVKLAENIVFLRDYVLTNLPKRASR